MNANVSTNIIPVPTSLMISHSIDSQYASWHRFGDLRLTYTVFENEWRLNAEVRTWILEQDPRAVLLHQRHNKGTFSVRFSNATAALLFKLTWGGS